MCNVWGESATKLDQFHDAVLIAMARCSECGARNAEQATFCVRCGAQLPGEIAQPAPSGEDTDRIAPVAAEDNAGDAVGPTAVLESVPRSDEGDASSATMARAERLLQEAADLLSRGDADAAAMRCREAVTLAPDLIAAYSLLGMAEEQRGNVVAAAGAYRRVLQLDPSRRVEREKLELLYAEGTVARPEDDRFEPTQESIVLRYAPWVAAIAAAFLVLMILTAVGIRMHAHRQAERIYEARMSEAQRALDVGDYQAAASAFQAALAVRPDDPDAQQGLRYARRKLAAASAGGFSRGEVARPLPRTTIVPSRGPNPFLPVPIGSRESRAEQAGQVQPQTSSQPRQRRTHTPPVVSTEPITGGQQTASSEPSSTEPLPFEPLEAPADETTGEAATSAQEPAAPEPQETEPRGEISIWVSEEPVRDEGENAPATSPSSSPSADARRADELRSQADQARARGECQRAAELYSAAIEAYRSDSEANPANRRVNAAAIEACERARSLCEAAGGQ